ncbi:MAG TPA: hypothetical protein VMI94_26475 [Bryobacteraceae bacterium]|nr:hypothetical protein [Bryobacteraceae bacterium]
MQSKSQFRQCPLPNLTPAGFIPLALGRLDAWEVRRQFLGIRTDDDALAFLRRTGVFSRPGEAWTMKDISLFQNGFRHMLLTRPLKWRASAFGDARLIRSILSKRMLRLEFHWSKKVHYAAILADTTLQAIVASIEVDHLGNASFGVCARRNCGRIFEFTTKHKRKYCSKRCGHAEVVRLSREQLAVGKPIQR